MYYLAVDIGASSGRHILCEKCGGKLALSEVYRFENTVQKKDGHLVWDVQQLLGHIVKGLKACGKAGKIPRSMAIDTWGVDFALIGKNGETLGDVVSYRDIRTKGMDALVEEKIPFGELYVRTGIQKQIYTTIYQLEALRHRQPQLVDKADCLLMMPDYLNYLLTGKRMHEYTHCSTSALLSAEKKDWDFELIDRLGYDRRLFGPLSMPGIPVGSLKPELAHQVGFDLTVMLCASHDTASAFLAVPAPDDRSVYLSSGTWSLLGVENTAPITTDESRKANFTNEGGYNYRFRYLKNIMGLWMIQSVRRCLDKKYSFPQLQAMAMAERGFPGRVQINDDRFLAPENMIDEVSAAATLRPQNLGQVMECIYRSLAECYRQAIDELSGLTGKSYGAVNIVGGGSQDAYLNALTAEYTGLPVYAGPTEGTAIGNLMVQMIADGTFSSLEEARKCVRDTFEIIRYEGGQAL